MPERLSDGRAPFTEHDRSREDSVGLEMVSHGAGGASGTIMVEPGSYRDRNGAVFYRGDRVFRGLSAAALKNWERLEVEPFFGELTASGMVVRTARAEPMESGLAGEDWAAVIEHERIPFISYPYEWSFSMLREAALLHLGLMEKALGADMLLKDSSAYNVQWKGAQPVFIDIPSFEPLLSGQPWIGYRQFCELFLYPLMLQAYRGVDFRPWLRGRIDGIPADVMRGLLSARDLLRPGVFMHVVLQSSLQRRYSGNAQDVRGALAAAGFDKSLILRNVCKLKSLVSGLTPAVAKTQWSDYDKTHSYDQAEFAAKRDFVREAAAARRWRLAWDLGCNTGTFSQIVSDHADYVVAMDADWMAIDHLYRHQQESKTPAAILPLVADLADPPPRQGWLGLERKALADRGRPDLTLCLALIHHIVITANIPMRDFVRWLAGLGTSLVIEFVGREDAMVKNLLCNKDDQYSDYSLEAFENLLETHFDIKAKRSLKGGQRTIYYALAKQE